MAVLSKHDYFTI